LENIKEEAVRPGALRLTAFHPAGTARMGADPATSVVDGGGEAHEIAGLFAGDTSILPNGLGGPNPTLTAQAIATRTAGEIARRYFA
jgi:choline dehydrogenase-like flavoprotein